MSFKGSQMKDIYDGIGPWNYTTLPVLVSAYHTILYQLNPSLQCPPEPHVSGNVHHWDDGYVRMPYSPRNLFPSKNEEGEEVVISRWELIKKTLQQEINSSKALEAAICSYNNHLPKFQGLHCLFREEFDEHETKHFFGKLLPGIVRLALDLDEIVPGSIPLLGADHCKSVSFSQKQIASLLANAFLCTFSGRKSLATTYPRINFNGLFSGNSRHVIEKIKCLIHYFKRVLDKMPCGVVTFERQHINRANLPRWDQISNNLGNVRIHIASEGTIEDGGMGLLQVDFANRFLGGGVLGNGCVQEEIRFVICPELLISRLIAEKMNNNEAVIITGIEQFSRYKGYGNTFEWDGNFVDETPFDSFGRRRTSLVAIDATRFRRPPDQFESGSILRELNKAYVGFHSRGTGQLAPVATGNWGCGAYRGNVHLKFLIQLMACSAARRDLVYFTFGSTKLTEELYNIYSFIATNQIRISELWRLLCQFASAGLQPDQFFPFIQQAYFDAKKQPKISDAFSNLHAMAQKQKFDRRELDTSDKTRHRRSPSPTRNISNPVLDEPSSSNNNMDVEDDPEKTVLVSSEFKRKRKTSGTPPSTDLISLISKIDGSPVKSSSESELNTSWGFLNCVDEYAKQPGRSPSKNKHVQHEVVDEFGEEEMDVEEILQDLAESSKGAAQSASIDCNTPKKKITDYFKKS